MTSPFYSPNDLLFAGEVAAYLGVSHISVRGLALRGTLPWAWSADNPRVPRGRVFRFADVEAYRLRRIAKKEAELERLRAVATA